MGVGMRGWAPAVLNLNGRSGWRRRRHRHASAANVHRVSSSLEPREFIHKTSLASVVDAGQVRNLNFEIVGGLDWHRGCIG